MSRKTTIQVGAIAVMLLGAGIVLYKGFHKSTPDTPATLPTATTTSAQAAEPPVAASSTNVLSPASGDSADKAAAPATVDSQKILPLGTKFDLSLIKKFNPDGQLNNFPKVDPALEVGPALNDIVRKNP